MAHNKRKLRWFVVSGDASIGLDVIVATYKSRKAAKESPEAQRLFHFVRRETPEECLLRQIFTD